MLCGILQISYLMSDGKATKEDKIGYKECEKGLELSKISNKGI